MLNFRAQGDAPGHCGQISPVQVAEVDSEAPVQAPYQLAAAAVAYCRTGRRSTALWALGLAPKLGAEQVLAGSRASGCDLEELRPRLVAWPAARAGASTD